MRNKEKVKHHEESSAKQTKFRENVEKLKEVIKEHGNPFSEESAELYSLDTKEVTSSKAVDNLHQIRSIGKEKFDSFVEERLIKQTVSLDSKLVKNRISVFNNKSSTTTTKEKNQSIKLVKQDELLFRRMLIACQNREPDMIEFFSHENHLFPPSLSQGGKLRHGNKSDLLQVLEQTTMQQQQVNIPNGSNKAMILDGPFITQILRPHGLKTFNDYAVKVFAPHIESCFKENEWVDLVWDKYNGKSLKSETRQDRGLGQRRKIGGSTPIPSDWQKLLRVNENKTELFSYLSQFVVDSLKLSGRDFIATDGDSSITSNPARDMTSFLRCNHEEADT